jgi:hypothetical protein
MNPQEIQTLISAMQTIAAVLSGLGVPGLVALALAAPALVLVTVLVLDHIRNTRMAMMQQEFRTDTTRILDAYRNNTSKILEAYRVDTQSVCKELGKEHAEAVRFYNDNVELVKDYERMADALQTLVINNTRAVERLITIVEARTK